MARHLDTRSFRSRALDNAAKSFRKQAAHNVPGITWVDVPPREGGGRHRDDSPAQRFADHLDVSNALGMLPTAPAMFGLEDVHAELDAARGVTR